MAITIQQSPGSKQPAYSELAYVVSSTNIAQENFRFVADIYISGVSTPTYFRQKKSPHPTLNVGVFDIHRILENYISHDISTSLYGFQRNEASWRQYEVQFREEYGISSGISVSSVLATGTSGDVINAAPGFVDFKDYAQDDYLMKLFGGAKFLTNAPLTQTIFSDENAWLYMMTESSGSIYYAQITTYSEIDLGGSLIDTHRIINVDTDSDRYKPGEFLRFGCGTRNLNFIPPNLFQAGGQSIITPSVKSYSVSMRKSNFVGISEARIFNIIDNCYSKFDQYRLHFLNKLGGFDSFTFNMIAAETTDIVRTLFKKTVGTTTATSFSYAKSDKENQELSVMYQDSLTMESDWVTEDEGTWLEELVHSPVVYLDHATHGLIALNITKSRHQKRKHSTDKLINIQIEAKYSHNNSRQRG